MVTLGTFQESAYNPTKPVRLTMQRARDNARAEGSNKVVEAGIQSLLYDKNLPPSWWQRAANDVMFLANRLPPYSIAASVPPDGDVPSPIERLLEGYVSRHQVYREIDCFVPVGTPALCHAPKVKGSDLEPKVRWGITLQKKSSCSRAATAGPLHPAVVGCCDAKSSGGGCGGRL